jgi:hypothetical protein
VNNIGQILGIARIVIGTLRDELVSQADGSTQSEGYESPRADYSRQYVQKDTDWESYPSVQEGTIEIEKTNEKETDKDQSSKKPGGEKLPRTVGRGWPKLEIGTTNCKDK